MVSLWWGIYIYICGGYIYICQSVDGCLGHFVDG